MTNGEKYGRGCNKRERYWAFRKWIEPKCKEVTNCHDCFDCMFDWLEKEVDDEEISEHKD